MVISDDALVNAAAVLAGSIYGKEDSTSTGTGNATEVVKIFTAVLAELRAHHGERTGREVVGAARAAVSGDKT